MPTARAAAPSLAFRAALALGLTVAFYALALGLAGLLIWFPLSRYRSGEYLDFRIAFICIVAGLLIFFSAMPRTERFTPPGPRLSPTDQPRLFAELRAVAEAVGEKVPAEVYLVPDVSAGVTQRSGLLGFGERRVMLLGLPLLALLRVSEFRAVLAHEYGHYCGGETRLGPFLYRTQAAIGRTTREVGQISSLLHQVFFAYAKLFLRVTHAVSRRQELAADALAARVAGAPAIANGLRKVYGAADVLPSFIKGELLPILAAGFRPPIAEGFHRFLKSPLVSEAVEACVQEAATQRDAGPYDSHPPLRERLEALGDPSPPAPDRRDPRAATLLQDLDLLELELLRTSFRGLPPAIPWIRWEEAGERVFLPYWRANLAGNRDALKTLTAGAVGAALERSAGDPKLRKLADSRLKGRRPTPRLATVAAGAVAILLVRRGWSLECGLGKEVLLRRGREEFAPFREAVALTEGKVTAEAWLGRCTALGIADTLLVEALEG